jgi:hypothetical protein
MDRNYREAIAAVAQADQLVNKATSPADFDLGAKKVQQAQKNLDALPVWFLGYYPQFYCNLFRCSWYFTLDEFQTARANVATMEVKIFQEKNAQTGLDLAEQAIATAKQQYQQATSNADKDKARDAWQEAIAQLKQVPLETRSGKTAKTKLPDYQQDFEQVAGGTLISAAQQFAKQAEQDAQNPPHTATEWQQVANLWEESIKLLKQVPLKDPGYLAAQKSLAESQSKLGIVQTRMQVEKESLDALEQAEKKIEYLLRRLPATPNSQDLGQIASELRGITYQLQKVKKETTAYPQAQELIQSAENKLKQLQPKK